MTPLHILLRQYRVAAIILTAVFVVLMWDMWNWFKGNHQALNDWANTSFVALAGTVIATVKWSLEQFIKGIEKDRTDNE